jgi:hypothetical protein
MAATVGVLLCASALAEQTLCELVWVARAVSETRGPAYEERPSNQRTLQNGELLRHRSWDQQGPTTLSTAQRGLASMAPSP